MGDRHSEVVQARSPAFLQKPALTSFGMTNVATSHNPLAQSIIESVPRGGSEEESEGDEEEVETEVLYLPGLLEVKLVASDQVSTFCGWKWKEEIGVQPSLVGFGFFCVQKISV